MADPLQSAAETLAPSRPSTNFFGSPQSQNVLSRYAVAGRNVAEQEKTAEAASRLASSRFQRAEDRRREVIWSREDDDFNRKKDFESTRGQVIVGISDKLRETVGTEGFLGKVAELQADLPPEAREDDAVKSLITMYSREHEFLNMERKQNSQMERKKRLSLEAGILSKDQLAKVPRDLTTGEFDIEALHDATVAEKARRELLEEQAKEKKAQGKKAETDLAASRKAEIEAAIKDPVAFPSEVDLVMKQRDYGKEDLFKKDYPDIYDRAKAFDDERLQNEYASAAKFESAEAYILAAKNPKMNDQEKARRKLIFDEAKRLRALRGEAPAAPAAAPSAAPAPAAPAAPAPAAPAAPADAAARLRQLIPPP